MAYNLIRNDDVSDVCLSHQEDQSAGIPDWTYANGDNTMNEDFDILGSLLVGLFELMLVILFASIPVGAVAMIMNMIGMSIEENVIVFSAISLFAAVVSFLGGLVLASALGIDQ